MIYTINELSPASKEKAIANNRMYNVECLDWWDGVYEDARLIGLELTSFDLGRRSECKGRFNKAGIEVAKSILAEHGANCDTVTDAEVFMKEYAALPVEDDEDAPSNRELEELEDWFLHELREDYRILLEREYEYLTSDESVAESLECNGVEFLEDGSIA
jgi:hypothetical protein